MVQDPGSNSSSQTASTSLPLNTETEIEYNFQFTSNASGNAYCLRTSNGGNDLANYDHVAQTVILHAPTITNVSLNNGRDIALVEGTTTTVYATSTVTDLNGYADMIAATSTIYRSSVSLGASCANNQSNCYQIPASQCTFSNCSGTQCTLSCRADIQYFADATDASSTNATSTWLTTLAVQDSTGLRDTQTIGGSGVELLTLYGFEINTPGLNFGTTTPGSDTGTFNAVSTVVNTGNSPIDIQLSGDPLTSGANSILVGQQKYATSTFTYAGCALCQVLTAPSIPKSIGVNIPKTTSTTTSQSSNVYFGIGVPNGTPSSVPGTPYQGINYFTAVAPGG
jgi:hypothetical protein